MKPILLVFTSTFPRWKNDTDPPFVFELSKRLTSDFEVHVLTPHYYGSEKTEVIDDIQVHRYRYFIGKYEKLAGGTGIIPTLKTNPLYYLLIPIFLFSALISLIYLCFKLKPAIIHNHWLVPQGLLAGMVSKVLKIPVLTTIHGADVFAFKSRLLGPLKRFALNSANKITVVSSSLKNAVADDLIDTHKVSIVPMGVDLFKFKRPSALIKNHCQEHAVLKLLYVGRLTEKKGVRYLIDAMCSLKNRRVNVLLTIVGHGELEFELKEYVKLKNMERMIQFTGGVCNDSLPKIYWDNDVFIGPSIHARSGDTEGFGLTFVEAAFAGCFLIGTNVGGINDIIENKINGILVDEKNARAIADAVGFVIQNRILAQSMAIKSCNSCAQNYDWSVIAERYKSCLKGLL